MSTARKLKCTVSEYLAREAASPEKHEYFRGEVFAMAGASPAHNRIASNIHWRLGQQLDGRECLPNLSDVLVNAASLYTYPDLSVVCPPIEREQGPIEVLLNPKVLIEVLSPSTERYDRNIKFSHYRQIASVQEILLVQQDAPAIEHYARQPDGVWALTTAEGMAATIELPCIGCQLALSHVYANVEFPPHPFVTVVS